MFDSMSDDAYVALHRRDDISKDWVYHGKLSGSEANEEYIANTFGGGTYRCQEKYRNDEGKWVIGRTRSVKLTGPYKPPVSSLPGTDDQKRKEAEGNGQPPAVQGSIPSTGDIMSAGILQLFQAASTQQQMMMQMFSAAQQSQATLLQAVLKQDTKLDIPALLAGLAPIVTAFLAQKKEDRDPLEMLKAVGEIVRANTGKQSDVRDAISAMRDLMEVRDMLSGEGGSGGDSDPLMGSLPKLVEVLAEEQALRKSQGGTAAAAPAKPLPAGTPAPAQVAAPLWQQVLVKEKGRLLLAARMNRDPGLIAEVAWEFAPELVKPSLMEFMQREDAASQMIALIPELAPVQEWVERFVAEARDVMFGEEGEEAPDDVKPEEGDDDDSQAE